MTAFYLGDVFGRSGCYDFAAAVATSRADINNPVGGFDNFEIVLNNSYRIAVSTSSCSTSSNLATS